MLYNPQAITTHQECTLNSIIEKAHDSYLKQSRLKLKPVFNILRVLSTFKKMYPQSPQSIYNWIIFISKHYNPKTLEGWKKSLQRLKNIGTEESIVHNSQIGIQLQSFRNKHHTINASQSSQSLSYKNSIRLSKQINNHSSLQQHHNVNDLSEIQYKNQPVNYSYVQSTKLNHLISFQPCFQQNKQNISVHQNSAINLNKSILSKGQSHNRLRNNQICQCIVHSHCHLSCQNCNSDNEDIKTFHKNSTGTGFSGCNFSKTPPISQSFVRYLPVEKDISIPLSCNPTKDLKQLQQQIDEREDNNNANRQKANTYYSFNTKIKSFAAILANYQAFWDYRELKLKADCLQYSFLMGKSLNSFYIYAYQNKKRKKLQQKAVSFNKRNQLTKTMNILKILYETRIENTNICKILKWKPLNFYFILNLVYLNLSNQTINKNKFKQIQSIDISIYEKINHYSNILQYKTVYKLIKNFGQYRFVTEDNILQLFQMLNKSIQLKYFQILKVNVKNTQKYMQIYFKKNKIKIFTILKNRAIRVIQLKKRKVLNRILKQNELLKKSFKVLLQTIYSTKIYSKRCQYLSQKHNHKKKKIILNIWFRKYVTNNKVRNQTLFNIEQLVKNLISIINGKFWKKLVKYNQDFHLKEEQLQKIITFNSKKCVINQLKYSLFLKIHRKIAKNNVTNMLLGFTFKKWTTIRKQKIVLTKMSRIVKNFTLREYLLPILSELHNRKLQKENTQIKLKKQIFNVLINIKNQSIQKQKQIQNQICIIVHGNKIIQALKENFYRQQNQKKYQEMRKKIKIILNQLQNNHSRKFIQELRNFHERKQKQYISIEKLKQKKQIKIKSISIKYIINEFIYLKKRKQLTVKNEFNKKQKISFFMDQNKIFMNCNKINQLKKIKFLQIFYKQYLEILSENEKKNKTVEIFRKKFIQKKVMKALVLSIIKRSKQNQRLEQVIYRINQFNIQLIEKHKKLSIKKIIKNCTNKIEYKYKQNKLYFIVLTNRLKQNKKKNGLEEKKSQQLCNLILKIKFRQLHNKVNFLMRTNQICSLKQMTKKKLGIFRFENHSVKQILCKRQLYMSIKFKSLKLQQKAIFSLKQNLISKNSQIRNKISFNKHENRWKKKDRFSTHYTYPYIYEQITPKLR